MIPFNLTAITRATPLIQFRAKTRGYENPPSIYPIFNHGFNFQPNQLLHSKTIFFNHGTTIFQKESHGRHTPIIVLEETEEPMAAEPIHLPSDESEHSTPNTTPDHRHESIYPDSINRRLK